jgi:signal transduction histidine kinase
MEQARVMVVEDEGLVALALGQRLQALGYDLAAVASSGEEAVERAVAVRPDIVLMDIMLEGAMDGIEAAARIREEVDVPVVYLTAYSDVQTLRRAKQTGALGYLVKPFVERELVTTLETALSRHSIEREQRVRLRGLLDEQGRELRQAEEAARVADRAKTLFLGNISHELRTPLSGLLGMAELLQATRLDARQREYVDVLLRSGRDLISIVNNLLDYADLEAGRLGLDVGPFDLRQLCDELVDSHRPEAARKGLRLDRDLEEQVPAVVLGDRRRLRQVLASLLANALKFTDAGGVSMHVRPAAGPDGAAGMLCFEVADTGVGVPEGARSRIFQRFEQADGSSTRRFGGAGLGLAICRDLVALMKGEIGLDSSEGRGSRFWFTAFLPSAGGGH